MMARIWRSTREPLFVLRVCVLARRIETVELAVVLGGELLDELRLHEMRLESREDARLEHVASDGQSVAAGAAVARVRAAVMVVAHLGEATAANAALDEIGEQIDGAPGALRAYAGTGMREIVTDVLLPRLAHAQVPAGNVS